MAEKFTVSYMALLAITWLIVKVTANEVSQFPRDLNVPSGANITMFCKFPLSQDTVDVVWWRKGEKGFLERDSRRQFTIERGRGTLVLWNVKFSDSGLYYCTVKFQEQYLGTGGGTKFTVFAPPTPVEIVPVGGFSSPRKLLCKTAAFYPEKLEIVWQRNNKQIRTGIESVTNRSVDGLYGAFSLLDITQSTRGKDVYTCLVSHVSLPVPANFSYIQDQEPQGADTKLILACALGGSAILVLIIILVKVKLKRSHGKNTRSLDRCQNEEPTKGNGADKLTYAVLQLPDSKNTPASTYQNKHALYADVNISKKL
ncbi:tyrosine-protein phosphatase non-receptor type substrate 1-like isoform X2 [Mobula birostris]|uniref:tyrosine-protein phosphatase non-receptor type substrate 1-like isoform X2 n=1 Tax=Mobula birostris TaxID=1983395 RepID=UPI003B27FCFC